MFEKSHIIIYTDGACHGNPGPGGYAAILISGKNQKELSGGFNKTTNNRMELMAAIKGLDSLKKPSDVTLYSDSQYLVRSMNQGWVQKWQANGWKRNKKDPALNIDLWKQILDLCAKHDVNFEWTKGHAGHPENERCDLLANQAAERSDLPEDKIYSSPTQADLF